MSVCQRASAAGSCPLAICWASVSASLLTTSVALLRASRLNAQPKRRRVIFVDVNNSLLASYAVPAFNTRSGGSFDSFSFLGVPFDTLSVFRVHITNGGFDLNLQQFCANDAVAMDDFIYGEPLAVPEPSTLLLFLPGLALLGLRRTGQRTS